MLACGPVQHLLAHLELESPTGSYSPQSDGKEITGYARYYHLRVTNRAKYPTADDVQVLLLGVERVSDQERRPGDLYVPLALGWVNGVYPLARSIGSKTEGIVDLLFVRDDGMRFVPIVLPFNFEAHYSGETHLRVTAIAKGIDCESNVDLPRLH